MRIDNDYRFTSIAKEQNLRKRRVEKIRQEEFEAELEGALNQKEPKTNKFIKQKSKDSHNSWV
jgi:thiamine pyrophosphate-dependent acetolactate synthase large subunit-like protein